MQSIFSKIAKKEIPSHIVYEDDKVMGIIDIYPASPGHLLLFPKEQINSFKELSPELVNHLAIISSRLTLILATNLKSKGVTSLIQEGINAGQKVDHILLHLIPRSEDDILNFNLSGDDFDTRSLESQEILHEDEDFIVMGFPSLVKGHLAIVPKEKYELVMKMPEVLVGKMYLLAQKFVKEMKYEANIILNTGVDQALPGVSLHIVPRKKDDDLNYNWEPRQLTQTELEELELNLKGKDVSKPTNLHVDDSVPDYYVTHLERIP
jgi:histidine triad (HIT) family protein